MMIGNAKYQCSCVQYVSKDNIALIVGLTVGIGLLLIIIIIIVIVLYRRRQSKQTEHEVSGHDENVSMNEDRQYTRHLPDDDIEVSGHSENVSMDEDKQYSRHLPDDDADDSHV